MPPVRFHMGCAALDLPLPVEGCAPHPRGFSGRSTMAHVRRDVWNLGSGWSDALLWYARGVGVLQQRPITDHTSWRFLAAIHGIDVPLWQDAGYLRRGDKLPSQEDQDLYWNQCQHQSWYFLPWHRGYVASFEQIVRAAIVGLGGPADWSLPYWNYNDNRQTLKMPACFAATSLPNVSLDRESGPRQPKCSVKPIHSATRVCTSFET